jgi:lipid A disaccharide synthetase
VIEKFGWARLQLVEPDSGADGADGADGAPQRPYLKTSQGLSIQLESAHPAYATLRQCALCITTVGANTAELGCLGVPMLVLLPTQQLEVMKAWDGLPGLVLNLPVVGDWLARRFNAYMLKRLGLLAWPNIWAKRQIVPELVGALDPQVIALQVLDYLDHPDQLAAMRQNLRAVRGQPGAADKIAQIVRELV